MSLRSVYLTWGEVPRPSGIYGGQVVSLVHALVARPEIDETLLVAGFPLLHSGMVREGVHYRKAVSEVREGIAPAEFVSRRLPVPPVGVHPTERQSRLFLVGHRRWLRRLIDEFRPDVVHCRSYLAASLAHDVRQLPGATFAIAFDPRSLMPEEGVVLGRWSAESEAFRFWKREERRLLRESDVVAAVSRPMRAALLAAGAAECELIHQCVVQQAEADTVERAPRTGSGLRLCYAGHLGAASWHDPDALWEIFRRVIELRAESSLTVITNASHKKLHASAARALPVHVLNRLEFVSSPTAAETVRRMQQFDVGVLSYRTPVGSIEAMCAESVFATKTAEYLSAGLPVLVNKVCGGARDFVTEHGVGLVYDETPLVDGDLAALEELTDRPEHIRSVARAHFDRGLTARRWASIYEQIRPASPGGRARKVSSGRVDGALEEHG